MLGSKLKELRASKGLVQRQIAAELEVDTAFISKVENDEKHLSKSHLKKVAKIYKVEEKDLMVLWLADKILNAIEDEDEKQQALELALENIK
ncbi:MAG: helix-turn-helix domain-containing protein [Chitinophagaceae bacterium]|nr:helix-turn-helix domain-containing protein [Chitinophagaceae bacterium]